jgi:hypothetical protein
MAAALEGEEAFPRQPAGDGFRGRAVLSQDPPGIDDYLLLAEGEELACREISWRRGLSRRRVFNESGLDALPDGEDHTPYLR